MPGCRGQVGQCGDHAAYLEFMPCRHLRLPRPWGRSRTRAVSGVPNARAGARCVWSPKCDAAARHVAPSPSEGRDGPEVGQLWATDGLRTGPHGARPGGEASLG